MNTSHTTFALSEPTGRDLIPPGVLEYFQTRNRMRVFSLVQREFDDSGITKAELADRLGKGPDRISHLLGAPGNWTLDTVSDLLFAISGAEIEYRIGYPLRRPARNMTAPEWLYQEPVQIKLASGPVIQATFVQTPGGSVTLPSIRLQVP
ncbi:MAG TPA: hypothetical protein VEK73_05585 [Xanthobacteraceae bacterium]|nr:hypothetical protein [Xanthobacteraceae bacterium]